MAATSALLHEPHQQHPYDLLVRISACRDLENLRQDVKMIGGQLKGSRRLAYACFPPVLPGVYTLYEYGVINLRLRLALKFANLLNSFSFMVILGMLL